MSETRILKSVSWVTAAALLAMSLSGCTVTKRVTFDKRLAVQNDFFSPDEATRKLEGRVATIHAWADSSRQSLVEVVGEDVRVRHDSTLWIDVGDGGSWAVPTDHVAMITFTRNHAAAEGFGFGIIAGIPLGVGVSYLTWLSIERDGGFDNGTASIPAGLGVLVAGVIAFAASILLGTVVGASSDGGETVVVVNGFTPPTDCVPSTRFPCGFER